MADAARMVEDLGYDAVDINLGCPAKKVVKCGGSGLLRDLPLLGEIFRSVRAAVKIPLTIKLRAGWDENSIVAVDVAKTGRRRRRRSASPFTRAPARKATPATPTGTSSPRSSEPSTFPSSATATSTRPKTPSASSAVTGCDAVMIGRAAATNPWIFRQMEQYAATGRYDHPYRRRPRTGYFLAISRKLPLPTCPMVLAK